MMKLEYGSHTSSFAASTLPCCVDVPEPQVAFVTPKLSVTEIHTPYKCMRDLFCYFFVMCEATPWQKARSEQIVAFISDFSSYTQFRERTVSEINWSPQIKLRADNKQLKRQKDRKASRWIENQNSNVDKWTIESRMPKTSFTPRGRKSNGGGAVASCTNYVLIDHLLLVLSRQYKLCNIIDMLLLIRTVKRKLYVMGGFYIAKQTDTKNCHLHTCFQRFSYLHN